MPQGVFRVPVLGGEPRLVVANALAPMPLGDGSLLAVRLNDRRHRQLVRIWPATGEEKPIAVRIADLLVPPVMVRRGDREVVFYGWHLDDLRRPARLLAADLQTGAVRVLADNLDESDGWTIPLAQTPDGREIISVSRAGSMFRLVALRDGQPDEARPLLDLAARPLHVHMDATGALYIDGQTQMHNLLVGDVAARAIATVPVSSWSSGLSEALMLADGRTFVNTSVAGRRRVMAFKAGAPPAPLLETDEETSFPMARVGPDHVAVVVGLFPKQAVTIVSVADGRIVRRLEAIDVSTLDDLVGSVNGKTLYYLAHGAVWAFDLATQRVTRIRDANDAALDPDGRYMLVALSEGAGVRLVQVPLDGGAEREIPFRDELTPAAFNALAPNAIARDGRVLVRATRRDSWYWPTAVLDPATGRVEQLWPHIQADMFSGWTDDGRVVSIAMTTSNNLWKFTPAGSPSSAPD